MGYAPLLTFMNAAQRIRTDEVSVVLNVVEQALYRHLPCSRGSYPSQTSTKTSLNSKFDKKRVYRLNRKLDSDSSSG